MATKWSKFQLNLFDEFVNGNSSFMVNAVAGSGKTTSALEMMKRRLSKYPNERYLFICFNKAMANENKAKVEAMGLARMIDVKTLHAVGFSAILRANKDCQFTIKTDKYKAYLTSNVYSMSQFVTIDSPSNIVSSFIANVSHLFDLCRLNLVKRGDHLMIQALAEQYNIDCVADNSDEINVVSQMLANCYQLNPIDKTLDYTDMLTISVNQFAKSFWQYDRVIIDEAQDLSKAQRQVMLCSIKRNGCFVGVGDPYQAINGFAGALNDSFDQLVALANGKELPLSVNYRCGKNIIAYAQQIYPTIQAFDGAIDGEVITCNNLHEIKCGDMVLCRKTAPLVSLCLKYLANGISAYVEGSEIAEGLKNLIKKTKAKTIETLFSKLDKEIDKKEDQVAKGKATESSLQTFRDKVTSIKAIASTCKKVDDIFVSLNKIFADKKGGNAIRLMTVHKSKGSECDRVHIIVPNKLPLWWKGQQEWEALQERHLQYVAYTRAKKQLFFVNLDEEQLSAEEL